jgi:FkbM family methyltransferase
MSDFNLKWIKQIIGAKENITIFDVGAFNFEDSIRFKINFPNANVYAFEAFILNCVKFSQKAIQNGVRTYNLAISDKNGETIFYNSTDYNGIEWTCSGSILKPSPKEGAELHKGLNYNKEGITVQTIRLDDFCKKNSIESIDIIHMDIQGAEYYAIKGLGEIRPKIIFCETCEYESYENSLTLNDLDNLLLEMGYEIKGRYTDDTLYILKK